MIGGLAGQIGRPYVYGQPLTSLAYTLQSRCPSATTFFLPTHQTIAVGFIQVTSAGNILDKTQLCLPVLIEITPIVVLK